MVQIVILILFILGSAYYDSLVNFTDHTLRAIIRFLFICMLAVMDFKLIILYSSIFFLLFDYAYNFFRGQKWYYIGKTAELDKIRRRLFGDYYPQIDITIKITIVILSILIQ